GGFADQGPGPWSAIINWGDGTSNTTLNPSGPGPLGGQSHNYAEEGTYMVTITVADTGNNVSASGMFLVTVSDQNVVVAGVSSVMGTEGALSATQAVATFTDPAGPEPNDGTHYSASIDWGDGTLPTTGTISLAAGSTTFTVSGNHTYSEEGSYTITITI